MYISAFGVEHSTISKAAAAGKTAKEMLDMTGDAAAKIGTRSRITGQSPVPGVTRANPSPVNTSTPTPAKKAADTTKPGYKDRVADWAKKNPWKAGAAAGGAGAVGGGATAYGLKRR